MTLFDALRALHPDKGFAVYAYEPGGPVLLEVHAGGAVLTTGAASLTEAVERAFPGVTALIAEAEAPPAEPLDDLFE